MRKRHTGLEVSPADREKAQQARACKHPFEIHDTTGERTDVKGQTKNLRRLLQHGKDRFKSLRVIQEISRRLNDALWHQFQIMIAAQPCLTQTLGKYWERAGRTTDFGNAQANVRHHAQARFTKHLLNEGEHNPMPRCGAQRHDFRATTFRSDFTCSQRRHVQPHLFLRR